MNTPIYRQQLAFQANHIAQRAIELEHICKILSDKAFNDMVFNGSENLARIARTHQVVESHTQTLWAKWEAVTSKLDEAQAQHATSII